MSRETINMLKNKFYMDSIRLREVAKVANGGHKTILIKRANVAMKRSGRLASL